MVAYLCCSSYSLILTLNMENLKVEQKDMIWKLCSLSLSQSMRVLQIGCLMSSQASRTRFWGRDGGNVVEERLMLLKF